MGNVSHRSPSAGLPPTDSVQALIDELELRIEAVEGSVGGSGSSNFVNVRTFSSLVVANDWVPAFTAAISAAVAGGYAGVYVPASSEAYTVKRHTGGQSIDLRGLSNFVLAGDGPNSVIKMYGSGNNQSWAMIALGNDSTNVIIRDLYLDGDSSNLTNLDAGQHTHTILIGHGNAGGYVHQAKVLGCTMTDMDGDGIAIAPLTGTFDGDEVGQVDIVGNRFINCRRSGISNQRNAEMLTIHRNYFEGTSDQDIDFEPSGSGGNRAPRRYIITNNHIVHSTAPDSVSLSGVSFTDPSLDNIFAFNHIIGGSLSMNDTRGVLVLGNYITGGTADARAVVSCTGTANGLRLLNNKIVRPTGAQPGKSLHFSNQGGGSGLGALVAGNTIWQYVAADGDNAVVMIPDCSDLVFVDNEVASYRASSLPMAVKVESTSVVAVSGVTVSRNVIAGARGGSVFTRGIKFLASGTSMSNMSCDQNTFSGCTNHIQFEATSGTFNTYPVCIGNKGTTGTVFESGSLAAVTAVVTGGNVGSAISVLCSSTPEGAVTAPIGSTAVSAAGGTSTTLYVKESGAGNTGWVAK